MSTEVSVWSGSPSQIKNIGYFAVCVLLSFLVIPLFLILWRWLQTKCTKYELTTERFTTSNGVLNKTTDHLELYRVRDYRQEQPFLLRMFGLSNITLVSTDKTDNILLVTAVKDGAEIIAKTRQNVEELRRRKARIS